MTKGLTSLFTLVRKEAAGELLAKNMDIDDILAEIDQDVLPQEVRDLHALTRAWVTERSAPEILPWPAPLMDRIMERIRQQVCSPYPHLGDKY